MVIRCLCCGFPTTGPSEAGSKEGKMSNLGSLSVINILNQGTSLKADSSFRIGEMLFGRISDVIEGCVVLSICGESYLAKTTLLFHPGESVRLRVEEKKKGKVVLKLIERKPGGQSSIAGGKEIKQALADMGIPASGRNVELARALSAYGLPLNKSGMQYLADNVSAIEDELLSPEEKARVCLLLRTINLPVNAQTASIVKLLFTDHVALADHVRELGKDIEALMGAEDTSLQGALGDLMSSGKEDLLRIFVDMPKAEGIPKQIKSFIELFAYERRFTSSLLDDNQAGQMLQNNLKARLLFLADSLEQARAQSVPEKAVNPDVDRLIEHLGLFTRTLSSLQLLNCSSIDTANGFIYLPVPIRLGDECATAEIRIFDFPNRAKKKGIDAANLKIAFLLSTTNLGRIKILLNVVNRHVDCRIDPENEKTRNVLVKHLPGLKQRFLDMGYPIESVHFGSFQETERSRLLAEEIGTRLAEVDIKV
jgi:hypothetical protein